MRTREKWREREKETHRERKIALKINKCLSVIYKSSTGCSGYITIKKNVPKWRVRLTWVGSISTPSYKVSDCHQVALSLLSWSVRKDAEWSPYRQISHDLFCTPVCLQNSIGRSSPHVLVASISTLKAAFSNGGMHLCETRWKFYNIYSKLIYVDNIISIYIIIINLSKKF